MRTSLPMVLTLVGFPGLIAAQEVIQKIEYYGGHAAMPKHVKGSLMLSDSALAFIDQHGVPLLQIPYSGIRELTSSMDRKDASFGSKLALGMFAKSRKDELVTISFESGETAEGIVFKTEKNMSATVLAKIQFHLKRAGFQIDQGKVTSTTRPPPAQI